MSYTYVKEESADFSISYLFLTNQGILYTVYFKPDEYSDYLDDYPFLLHENYALGFYPNKKGKPDNEVGETICEIVIDFLEQSSPGTVALYHCDHSDGKQAARDKMFDKWDANCGNTVIEKCSIQVQIKTETDETKKYFIGLISKKTNPNLDKAITELEQFAVDIANQDHAKSGNVA